MEPDVIFNVQQGPYWDWRVAVDLFLGGAGVGALLFAIVLDEIFPSRYRRICQTAAWLSPLLVVAGLAFLLVKLGRPFHLLLTYTNFNPHSPLWWGGVFQPLLVIGGLWYALKWNKALLQPDARDTGRRLLGWVLAPLAIVVGGYHGLLLAIVTARPLWNTGPTVVSAMLGFLATGIAAVMLVHLVRMKFSGRMEREERVAVSLEDMKVFRNVLFAALILQLGTFFLWWLSLNYGSLQDQQALAAANAAYGPMFWWFGIGLGLVLPLILGALTLLCSKAIRQGFEISVITLTSAMILVGGYFFRLAVVLGGQVELPVTSLF
jgi:protein NrfD